MLPLVIFKLIYISLIQEVDLLNRKAKNMKRNISNLIVIVFLLFQMIFTACNTNGIDEDEQDQTNTNEAEAVVYVKDNMFVFKDYEHINRELAKFSRLSNAEKNKWLKGYGIKTYGQVFRQVIDQEDSISNYYSSLPEEEQAYYLSQPQVFSDCYKKALNDGIITMVKSGDDEYFDLNLIDKKYADFLNLNGRLIVGMDIISVNSCEEKVFIKALDSSSLSDFSKFKSVTIKEKSDTDNNLKSEIINDWSQISAIYPYDKNIFGNYTKRVWAEIEGWSKLVPSIYENSGESDCYAKILDCTFELKAYAQSKNFWGKWVFGNWSTYVTFDAEWHYRYQMQLVPNNNKFETYYDDFGTYSCTPNSYYPCPTSPFYEERTGNGCITPLSPDGVFYLFNSTAYYTSPIDVYYYNIHITVGPKTFDFFRLN